MNRMSKYRKSIAWTVMSGFLIQLFLPVSAFAVSEGPMQPEVAQFEPVDITDLVNVATGDFLYNIPLLEVPGPEGGYPINISYHAGIGLNQEPTWVGLGWTLNPGAINRFMNGYPDDFKGDFVKSHYEADAVEDRTIGIDIGYSNFGLNMSFSSNTGFSINSASFMLSLFGKGSGNLDFSVGKNGVGLGLSYGKLLGGGIGVGGAVGVQLSSGKKPGYYAGGGVSFNFNETVDDNGRVSYTSQSLLGISWSSGGSGASFSIAGAGFSNMTLPGGGTVTSSGFSTPRIPIGPIKVGFSYHKTRWSLNETYDEKSYGYLNQTAYHGASGSLKKYERTAQGQCLYSSQDNYSVSAPGISGLFMPFVAYPYSLHDDAGNTQKAKLNNTFQTNPYPSYTYPATNTVQFRFLDDQGANCIANDNYSGYTGWGANYNSLFTDRSMSRKIVEHYDSNDKICGFTITDRDGKVYEFKQPVYQQYQNTRSSKDINVGQTTELRTATAINAPFATSWLLTCVKSPDYIDRGASGLDEDDWGHWVKLDYQETVIPQRWRSPYEGFAPHPTDMEMKTMGTGIRESWFLDRIETKTHIAVFEKTDMKCRDESGSNTTFPGEFVSIDGNGICTYRFPGQYIRDYLTDIYNDPTASDDQLFRLMAANGQTLTSIVIGLAKIADISQWSLVNGWTEVKILPSAWVGGVAPSTDASFIISEFMRKPDDSGTIPAKQLDAIRLYSKADPAVVWSTGGWSVGTGAESIRSVEFQYDYSLCQNTPNSTSTLASDNGNKGKLTLKSLRFKGRNNVGNMPPYQFEYANGAGANTGMNPDFHADGWDVWGSYKTPDTTPPIDYRTPQNQTDTNIGAWSLTKITVPTGGTIEIEYERDDYYKANNFFDLERTREYSLNVTAGVHDDIDVSGISWIEDPIVGQDIILIQKSSDDITSVQTRKVTAMTSSLLTIDQSWTRISGYSAWIAVPPPKIMGGGIRVKSLKTFGDHKINKTIYKYCQENEALSSGVTATLPHTYQEHDDFWTNNGDESSHLLYYYQLYTDHELSVGRPAANVFYSRVEVINVDNLHNEPLNGKTVYEFYTANDYPYTVTKFPLLLSLTIIDKSGIYMKPKSVTYYEQFESGGSILFRPVRKEQYRYAFSSELMNYGYLNKKSHAVYSHSNEPLGLTQEKYHFSNEYESGNTEEYYVDRRFENVFNIGKNDTTYYYDSPTATQDAGYVVNAFSSFVWDALTGQTLANAGYGSDGKAEVVRTTPAYWKYPDMEADNMLTQHAQSSTFLTDIANISAYEFPSSNLVGSEVTTWSDNWSVDGVSNPVYRKARTFVYNPDLVYVPFSDWQNASAAYGTETSSFPWRMTSNITQYDEFSHPVEESHVDGTYSSALYRYGGGLPVAVAKNAPYNQIQFFDFEEDGSTPAQLSMIGKPKTGERCWTFSSSGPVTAPNGSQIAASTVNPVGSRYIASAWIKNTSQTDWTYFEVELSPGEGFVIQPYIVGSSGFIDHIRIFPKNATLSTFAYDAISQQVTSITDANNITTYFEYDEYGRLILVRDHNRDIKSLHKYNYRQ